MVAYWIAHVDVLDPEAYEPYRKPNAAAFNKYNVRFIVRGGQAKVVEGAVRSRTVVIEFDDYETAKAFQRAKKFSVDGCRLYGLLFRHGDR